MKITLEFEDYEEAEVYLRGGEYFSALHDFKNWLRDEWKHGEYDEKEFEIVEKIYESFNDTLNTYKIDL
jgi:viroplasmin and RNaseH domain-containing protein